MRNINEFVEKHMDRLKAESGQTFVEYGLILILIAIVVIIMLVAIGNKSNTMYSTINSAMP